MEQKTIEQHYRILGLEPGASMADVKEAYRFLVQTFHEDKYPADHPYRDRARNKMVELNDSYDQLKTFFQENPSGEPPGGWSSKDTHQDEYRGTDDTMDWKSWQYDQEQNRNRIIGTRPKISSVSKSLLGPFPKLKTFSRW